MSDFQIKQVGNVIVVSCPECLNDANVTELFNLLVTCMEKMKDEAGIALDLAGKVVWDARALRQIAPVAVSLRKNKKQFWALNAPFASASALRESGMDSAIKLVSSLQEITAKAAPPVPKLDVNFLNPFVDGTVEALKIQCSTEVVPGKISIKKSGDLFPVEIAAVLGIMSPSFNGSIAICFPKRTFLNLMEKMLGESYPEITKDLEDGAGELLNIVFGHAKRELNELGYGIEKAIPTVVRGNSIEVRHMTPSPTLILQFESVAGKFHIEMGMTVNAAV